MSRPGPFGGRLSFKGGTVEDVFGPGGWVKVHRKIIGWQWASSSNHMALFMQILLRANYKVTKWRKEIIAPGQLLTGSKQLGEWTGLSRMQIRKVLTDLVDSGEITIKTTNKYSIITITRWDDYQIDNQQITNKQPTNNQQITTSKKANNTKNEKNSILNIAEKNLPEKNSKAKRKGMESSPLAFLFDASDPIQEWLLTGTEAAQKSLLEKHSHHVLAEEIRKAYCWQLEKRPRQAGTFLLTWMSNKNTLGFGANRANTGLKQGGPSQSSSSITEAEIQRAKELGIL